MANAQLAYLRQFNQRILGAKFEQPEDVVRWMGAMQAQDYHQAVWAIGLRTSSARLVEVEQAIADRKIVRTWPVRGTIHFVPSEDAKWMLRLSAARMLAADHRRQEQLELNEAILQRCQQLIYDALSGDRRLTREDLLNVLESAGIATHHQRGYHILWYAAQNGLICIGPMQEKRQTFVLLEDWAPHARELSRAEALAELARRFFASHGPATLPDFARWAGLPITDAREGVRTAGSLIAQTIDGSQYWQSPLSPDMPAGDGSDIHLLPGFDEYLIGYSERGAVLASEHASKIVPGANGVFRPMIVIGGQVVGTWKRTVKKKAVEIVLSPFQQMNIAEDRVLAAAQQYSRFLGMPLSAVNIAPDD